jgi:hypothetical protein
VTGFVGLTVSAVVLGGGIWVTVVVLASDAVVSVAVIVATPTAVELVTIAL